MKKVSWKTLGILIAIAAAQIAFIVHRVTTSTPETDAALPPTLAVGDLVTAISGVNPDGEPTRLELENDRGEWTALLAFHSECAWCAEAAPHWREWLGESRPFRIVAITSDSIGSALGYVGEHDWSTDVLSVAGADATSLEGQLTGRTPWAYLVDAGGAIRYQGNGADLTEVDRAYRDSR